MYRPKKFLLYISLTRNTDCDERPYVEPLFLLSFLARRRIIGAGTAVGFFVSQSVFPAAVVRIYMLDILFPSFLSFSSFFIQFSYAQESGTGARASKVQSGVSSGLSLSLSPVFSLFLN